MTVSPEGAVHVDASWELFPHDADVGVRGLAPTIEGAFEQAALALKAIVTDAEVLPAIAVEVQCHAPDIELLFVDWLNAIIYEMAVRRMVFGRTKVGISRNSLSGTLWGEAIDRERHAPACEPKGATYTALKVGMSPSWRLIDPIRRANSDTCSNDRSVTSSKSAWTLKRFSNSGSKLASR